MLKNKIILITGGTGLLGRSIAKLFVKEGAIVLLSYYNNESNALKVLNDFSEKGTDVHLYKADLRDYSQIDSMFASILKQFKTIDILINNAGLIGPCGDFEDLNMEEIANIFNLNLLAPIYLSKLFLKVIKHQEKTGLIINTSSSYGNFNRSGDTNAIPYCITKSGLDSLSIMLSKYTGKQVRVNSVCPGPIYDEKLTSKKDFDGKILIDRWVHPDEVAEAYVFLAKNEAMDGHLLTVDGGFFNGL